MVNPNLFRLCTAALAGSIIGIVYERTNFREQLPFVPKSVKASSATLARNTSGDLAPASSEQHFSKIDVIDPVVSAENLKHSARFGLPSKDNIRVFNDFLLSYDRRLRAPVWVIEHLTPEKLKHRDTSRSRSRFHEDEALHPYFRASNADFMNTGFDRGHMAAAGNHKNSQDDLDQTFAFSNISPQRPDFNRGGWERLESYVRWRAKRANNLWVVTGPLYLPLRARNGNLYVTYRVLGGNQVSVPTHYFKVFLVEERDGIKSMEAFVMPNDDSVDRYARLDDFRVPIEQLDTIERASGVIFFDQVERQKLDMPVNVLAGFQEDYQAQQQRRLPATPAPTQAPTSEPAPAHRQTNR